MELKKLVLEFDLGLGWGLGSKLNLRWESELVFQLEFEMGLE